MVFKQLLLITLEMNTNGGLVVGERNVTLTGYLFVDEPGREWTGVKN